VGVFGNVDIWLANSTNTASALRFYEAQSTTGTFPAATTNYTAFRAGTQGVDITYTLPTTAPTSNGQVLSSTTAGVMSWATPSGGLTNFTESVHTSLPNGTIPVVRLLATNSATNVDIALTPKGNGALTGHVADNGIGGGNKRGTYAVDWQINRGAATQVASANSAVISGGGNNSAYGVYSVVSGGYANTAGGQYAVVGGGNGNSATGAQAIISGGVNNTNTGDNSNIAGGLDNFMSGDYGAILGGTDNRIEGALRSAILGGTGLRFGGGASNSIGFNGITTVADSAYINTARTAYFGNVNMWLGNTNNTASELRFYEAQAADGTFPASGTNYTAFRAGTQGVDITYTLPTTAPSTNGQVLSSTTAGVMSWATPSTGTGDVVTLGTVADNRLTRYHNATGDTIQSSAIVIDDYTTTTQNNVTIKADDGSTADISLVLAPKGNGALIASKPDGTATGGDARGNFAVDLQLNRTADTMVASGNRSVIAGGSSNTASGFYSIVLGGLNNTASGVHSKVFSGNNNVSSGDTSSVISGSSNLASGTKSIILTGRNNVASGDGSAILSGQDNVASGLRSVVLGGHDNVVAGAHNLVFGENVVPSGTADKRIYFFNNSDWGKFLFNTENINAADVFKVGETGGSNGNGARLTTGGTWTNASSRTLKDRFKTLDSSIVLQKVKQLELKGWFYKGLNEYHIGPFAEDFFSAFGTGTLDNPENNKTVASLDVAGVALYSSQQLIKQNEAQEKRINELEEELASLKKERQDAKLVEERLKRLEAVNAISALPSASPSVKVNNVTTRIISIVPDPASSSLVIKFEVAEEGGVTLRVMNSNGTERASVLENISMKRGVYEMELGVQDYVNGWYVAVLESNGVHAQRLFRVIH
ncbi:MAG: hypothetical protein JNL32_10510, partial [Candidatus Kapabacteria bacterium]|nr:hypothetical protein [Candidatus Kapabacteria bacterium]